jgi:DNA-binding LacI/PurR family transcriptional regulator
MAQDTRTNIREIARRAGVSIATVSRVINNSPLVKADTRERVLGIMRKLRFQPNLLAQSLSRGQPLMLGVFTHPEPDMKAHYFVEVLRGINQALAASAHSLVINPEDFSLLRGALLLAPSLKDPLLNRVTQNKIPAVLINASSPRFFTVDVDNVAAAYEAVDHLLQLGHRRVACIDGNRRVTNDRDRLEGYRRALQQHRIPFDETLVVSGDFDEAKGYEAMKRLLSLKDRPTAVFAANDHMAVGAIKAARDAGLQVPQEVAVAGFDDIDLAPYITPPLTTVRQPLFQLGYEAARLLLDLLSGKLSPLKPRQMLLEGKLIIRRSCGAYAGAAVRKSEVVETK